MMTFTTISDTLSDTFFTIIVLTTINIIHSLPRMSDDEDNDDLYESDAPSEESERDEDSPQRSY